MKPFLKIIIGVSFRDTFHLKEHKQYIIVANHNSHIDTMAIMCSVPFNMIGRVHPVAAKDYFASNFFTKLMSNLFVNAKYIDRNTPSEDNILLMKKWLDEGCSLIIFPEGSRGKYNEKRKFKSGVSRLLKLKPEIAYVPAYIDNTGFSLPKGDLLPIPICSNIQFSKAQFINQADSIEEITKQIEDSVTSLNKD